MLRTIKRNVWPVTKLRLRLRPKAECTNRCTKIPALEPSTAVSKACKYEGGGKLLTEFKDFGSEFYANFEDIDVV